MLVSWWSTSPDRGRPSAEQVLRLTSVCEEESLSEVIQLLVAPHPRPHPRLLEAERGHGRRFPPPRPPAAARDDSPQRHPCTEDQRQVHQTAAGENKI